MYLKKSNHKKEKFQKFLFFLLTYLRGKMQMQLFQKVDFYYGLLC
jgi:hypothetical protein